MGRASKGLPSQKMTPQRARSLMGMLDSIVRQAFVLDERDLREAIELVRGSDDPRNVRYFEAFLGFKQALLDLGDNR